MMISHADARVAMITEMCPCGRPLHYDNVAVASHVLSQIKMLGRCAKIPIEGKPGLYILVPRHWIALHGPLNLLELEELADDYGWEYVSEGK